MAIQLKLKKKEGHESNLKFNRMNLLGSIPSRIKKDGDGEYFVISNSFLTIADGTFTMITENDFCRDMNNYELDE